jgi:hypothetical protein
MRVKVLLVDSPLRIGETARVEFRAAWHRGSLHGTVPKFHLRCLREDPSGFRGFATRVDTLADLVPHRTEIAGERKNVNLSLAFDLPPGLPGSDLLAARPVYWVLDVEMSIPLTFHFRKRYFLPVEGAAAVTSASRPALATRPVSS